jgi:hypothetical protein
MRTSYARSVTGKRALLPRATCVLFLALLGCSADDAPSCTEKTCGEDCTAPGDDDARACSLEQQCVPAPVACPVSCTSRACGDACNNSFGAPGYCNACGRCKPELPDCASGQCACQPCGGQCTFLDASGACDDNGVCVVGGGVNCNASCQGASASWQGVQCSTPGICCWLARGAGACGCVGGAWECGYRCP